MSRSSSRASEACRFDMAPEPARIVSGCETERRQWRVEVGVGYLELSLAQVLDKAAAGNVVGLVAAGPICWKMVLHVRCLFGSPYLRIIK